MAVVGVFLLRSTSASAWTLFAGSATCGRGGDLSRPVRPALTSDCPGLAWVCLGYRAATGHNFPGRARPKACGSTEGERADICGTAKLFFDLGITWAGGRG